VITSAWDDGGVWGEITMHHSGDFSGEVEFMVNADRADVVDDPVNNTVTFRLPFKALKKLVAEHVQQRRIDELENGSDDLILGI
jgi:hypothetical protein